MPADQLPLDESYQALRHGLAVAELHRDVVRVSGPDAERYLQGQLSQDVSGLPVGGWAWALVLQPQGKLDAFVRCWRGAPDEFLLDTDAGIGPALAQRLLRFRLRTKADVDQLEWRVLAVRGPAASLPAAEATGEGIAVPFQWGGLNGYDLLGPRPSAPPGALAVTEQAYEVVRIEAGFPRHGAELDERTIPAEAGLVEAAVSFTKGCYTGQELVARIDSRGSNVPRHLRGFLLSGPAQPGDRLYLPVPSGAASAGQSQAEGEGESQAEGEGEGAADGTAVPRDVGRLTSVARSPRLGWVALGYVGRAVEVGATVVVSGSSAAGAPAAGAPAAGAPAAGTTAQVQLLPLAAPGL